MMHHSVTGTSNTDYEVTHKTLDEVKTAHQDKTVKQQKKANVNCCFLNVKMLK